MGLVALALENTTAFPTFPRRMSPSEISAGLVLPYAAEAILGKAGAVAVLVLMFLSCQSACSTSSRPSSIADPLQSQARVLSLLS